MPCPHLRAARLCVAAATGPLAGASNDLFIVSKERKLEALCPACLWIISKSFTSGQAFDKAIVKYEWLKKYGDGLIAISGAEDGEVGHYISTDQTDKLNETLIF